MQEEIERELEEMEMTPKKKKRTAAKKYRDD